MERMIELNCECGAVWERPVDDDENKNELVNFKCGCGHVGIIIIAESYLR